jgi:hypothetical protein
LAEVAGAAGRRDAEVEVLEVRDDKPLSRLRTTIVNQWGLVVLDGTTLVWTEPL